jgi:hypothetical protein
MAVQLSLPEPRFHHITDGKPCRCALRIHAPTYIVNYCVKLCAVIAADPKLLLKALSLGHQFDAA